MVVERLIATPPELPVVAGLAAISTTPGNLVITAPPGSGKTTLVPPLMAALVHGAGLDMGAGAEGLVGLQALARAEAGQPDGPAPKVIVVQPRRVAARAAARRIASLIGEPVGGQVGFRVRGQTRPGSRIEMVTPGVMLRVLQRDPELAGVGALIIDEIHERDLDTDLVTAFALDVQETLRPDLRIVAMSATVAAERFAELLGGRVVDVPGAIHPVETIDAVGPRALGDFGYGVAVSRDFLTHVARVTDDAVASRPSGRGSVLVFMPGVGEIEKMRALLAGAALPVYALHGSLPAREQDRVLAGGEDRIIVATSVAESSLTVPGVNTVVDSGLAREPRFDPRTGISGLVTVHASRARMTQRSGRAGREGLGRAFRCLSFARAVEFSEPEILAGDVTDATLQAAAWGNPRMEGLRLLDDPSPASADAAQRTLAALGAVEPGGTVAPGGAAESGSAGFGRTNVPGTITRVGRLLAELPLTPQLGRGLIEGARAVGAPTAAGVAALLSIGVRARGADLAAELRTAISRADGEWTREKARLEKIATAALAASSRGEANADGGEDGLAASGKAPGSGRRREASTADAALAAVVALAYPTWIARRRGKGYVLAGGAGAVLAEGSPLAGEEWLAVAELGAAQGRADAVIRAAVPLTQDDALAYGSDMLTARVETAVHGTKVTGRRIRSLGAIELGSEPVALTRAEIAQARAEEIARVGVGGLAWGEAATALRRRMAFLHDVVGEPWPDVSDEALAERVDEWLTPLLGAGQPDLLAGLRALLPWPEAARLDELAPERIPTPTGSARVDYSRHKPTARLKLQEAFGWVDTPTVAGVPVTLELLSPAQRPLAITEDLASFWAGPYAHVRAEMRGRYPRHPWPEDPLTAEPTRRAKPRT
ncbi:ATP-dependent helicase HrpB [Trueperella pecoris]|uniref:ATP-dependent helicase HrpB n=1 Tax=Trueperella pecoris TaxID=2733571 RepID=A0A7M1QZU2_9ACTO|nr:ATP-dependent helicase HrpB [Trueperella pecoris]